MAWQPVAAPFPGEFEHRINLCTVLEHLPFGKQAVWVDVGGPRYYFAGFEYRRLRPSHVDPALSFPASLLVGPDFDDGIPF